MLENILENRINIVNEVSSWQEAIKIASLPLIDDKSIKEEYVRAMIENINKFGSYIVVAPDVAMPHARPEGRVNKNCLSLLKLNNPIYFDEDDEESRAYLIFVLGAVDNNSHIETLTSLMDIIDDEEKVQKIIEAKNIEEIKKLI